MTSHHSEAVLEIQFVGQEQIYLDSALFEHPEKMVSSDSEEVGRRWSRGLAALCLLAIRTRIARNGAVSAVPIKGGAKSPARSLYQSWDDSDGKIRWAGAVFGRTLSNECLFRKALERGSDGSNFTIRFREPVLKSKNIEIFWDGERLEDDADLIRLLNMIESQVFQTTSEFAESANRSAAVELKPTKSRVRASKKVLHIGILRSDLAYCADIRNGFVSRLTEQLSPLGFTLEFIDRVGPACFLPEKVLQKIWADKAKSLRFIQDQKVTKLDFLIGIGTQACVALKQVFGAELGSSIPLVFIGVTSPLSLGLVESEKNREEISSIAGVAYGDHFMDVVARARQIFPERELKFVFDASIRQDGDIATALRTIPNFQDIEIIEIAGNKLSALNDRLGDPNAAYLGWFSIEALFELQPEVFTQRLVIATTRTNCAAGLAVAAIAADDSHLGSVAADLIARNLNENVHLGSIDVVVPPIHTYLNILLAEKLNIMFSKSLLESAREVFVDGNSAKTSAELTTDIFQRVCVK